MYCYVRDCPNGLNSLKKKKESTNFFPVPEDKSILEKWKRVTPIGENELSSKDKLCDNHFLPSEVLWFTETKLPNGNVRRLLRDEPILRPGTIPSIFPAERLDKKNATVSGKVRKETPKPIVKNPPSMKDRSTTPRSIVKNVNDEVKMKNITPKSDFRIRFKDPIESSGKRNPQRVKRRSTILDDYWTDDELNQVHHSGGSRIAGSTKKRKIESEELQPVIRLVPLESLMGKNTPKAKGSCKPIVGNRPSTEEIDHELKKVIEIPLLTQIRPKKSLIVRSTKETVHFKYPKKTVSRSRMRMAANSEIVSLHEDVTANTSEVFNEIKTETPDIEEELARMEMDEENEDVKCSDIIMTNPSIGDDDNCSMVVKSEEEDDGYSFYERMDTPVLITPEGEEIPTIKSESEEEPPAVEVDSSPCDNDMAVDNQIIHVPESEPAASSDQGSVLRSENSDKILLVSELPKVVPEVPTEAEQNKDREEHRTNAAVVIEKSISIAAEDADVTSTDKGTVEGEETNIAKESGLESAVLEDQEKEETSVTDKEGRADMAEVSQKEVNAGEDQDVLTSEKAQTEAKDTEESQQEVEGEKKGDESATESLQEAESERKENENEIEKERAIENESAKEIGKETQLEEIIEKSVEKEEIPQPVEKAEMPQPVEKAEMPQPVENEEMPQPVENEEMPQPVENEEMPQPVENEMSEPVENEASRAAEGEMKETNEDGKHCEATVVSEEPVAEMAHDSEEPSGVESEKNLSEDVEILNKDGSNSNNVNSKLPEADSQVDGGKVSETDKGEDEAIVDEPSKPDESLIDVSDSEGVASGKASSTEVQQGTDDAINVDPIEEDQPMNNEDTPIKDSSATQEVEPKEKDDDNAMEIESAQEVESKKNDECAMETDGSDGPASENRVEESADDVILLATGSPVADGGVTEPEKNSESENKESKQPGQPENYEEMDIEAEVARLVSEVEETTQASPSKKIENDGREGNSSNSSQQKEKQPEKESVAKETNQPPEIVLQDTTNLGGITAAGVQNLINQETIQEILKQIKLPLTTPVTFRIAPLTNTPGRSSSGRGRGRKKSMRGMRGTSRQLVPRASSSRDDSHNSIDLFRHLTRTRTVFDFPTYVPDINDDMQYWKMCQILKESFHELIETRNTKTSIGKLTLRVSLNRAKKPKVQQSVEGPEGEPQ